MGSNTTKKIIKTEQEITIMENFIKFLDRKIKKSKINKKYVK